MLLLLAAGSLLYAQPVTGVWRGKINHKRVELKIVKNGDSITGTSYYYESAGNYRRYSIKGYFDGSDNSFVWWDDELIEEKRSNRFSLQKLAAPQAAVADYNCPGGTKMYLNGQAGPRDEPGDVKAGLALQKFDTPLFPDEWDFIIENYTVGANDPGLIDSVGRIAFTKPVPVEPVPVAVVKPAKEEPPLESPKQQPPPPRPVKKVPVTVSKPLPVEKPDVKPVPAPTPPAPLTNEQKFASRTRQLVKEIAVAGDSIELRFYDNAEVDGDSIAIFLNGKMLYEHIRLSDKPYTVNLAVSSLDSANELVMVAENLGSIPPNTSLMVAQVDGVRYEERLESTEQSSAVIRFVRKSPPR